MEDKFNDVTIQKHYRKWLMNEVKGFSSPLAITLTFPFSTNREQAIKKLNKLHNQLSRWIYKNANKRFGKMIKMIPIIEGENTDNTHFHLIMDTHYKSKIEFARKLEILWQGVTDIQDYDDSGWLDYITKRTSKDGYIDSLVVENINFNVSNMMLTIKADVVMNVTLS